MDLQAQARLIERVNDLEAQMHAIYARHSALEWFVEQHLANALLDIDRADADRFLDDLKHVDRAWSKTGEGVQPTPPDFAERMRADIEHIAEKVRTRVHQGRRR